MIELQSITKSYQNNIVNDDISCTITKGEIHAFLGENGAGKTTLMNILAGYVKQDKGIIKINNKKTSINSPTEAKSYGIGMVHQQFSVIEKLTVLENLIIGNNTIPVFFSKRKIEKKINELLSDIGVDLNINEYVGNLDTSDRQLVEIIKLLWCENEILILDEPLSQLSFFEGEKVLNLVSKLAKIKNKTILLISHNITEILKYADRVTVLRNGKLIKTLNSNETNEEELANLMIGNNLTEFMLKENNISDNSPLISIRNIFTNHESNSTDVSLRGINIDIMKGEILGIAGVKNNGQESLLRVLHGNLVPNKGTIIIKGKNGNVKSIHKRLFVSCIPTDSNSEGSISDMSITENLLFKKVENGDYNNGVLLRNEQMEEVANSIIKKYGIQPTSPLSIAKNLSGGNLQKTIIARELESNWELLLASNPFSGLDIKFSKMLLNLFIQYRNEGRTILFQSNNVTHMFEICDRIAVFYRGNLMGILNREEYQLDKIAILMGGVINQ